MQIQTFVFGPFQENTYVLSDAQNRAVLIDPGNYLPQETARLTGYLEKNDLRVTQIWLTHGHIDHVAGLQWAYDTFQVPVRVHQEEKEILDHLQTVAQRYGFAVDALDIELQFLDGNLEFDGQAVEVFHTPGHSPGSVSYYFKRENLVISGDVLFRGSIGRTDLYKGDLATLLNSIRTHLLSLPDATRVFSGHGPVTEIGLERHQNPFLV